MVMAKETTYKLMVNSTNLSEPRIVKCDCRMLIYKYLLFVPCQMWYWPGIGLVERKAFEPRWSDFKDIIHAYIQGQQNTKERRVKFF